MTALQTRLVQHQGQTMAPRLQQQVRLLQLSSLEFMQEIHGMLDVNPFLEAPEAASPISAPKSKTRNPNHPHP